MSKEYDVAVLLHHSWALEVQKVLQNDFFPGTTQLKETARARLERTSRVPFDELFPVEQHEWLEKAKGFLFDAQLDLSERPMEYDVQGDFE